MVELQTDFKDLILVLQEEGNSDKQDVVLRQAGIVLMKYDLSSKRLIDRIKWISQQIQFKQMQECHSHIADIDYKRVFMRSFLFSVVIALIVTLCTPKTKKKVKEL